MIEADRIIVTDAGVDLHTAEDRNVVARTEGVDPKDSTPGQSLLLIIHGENDIFLGPPGVTAADGVRVTPAMTPLGLELYPGEALRAITAAGLESEVHILRGGVG